LSLSRESWREQERTRNADIREELRASRDKMPGGIAKDHKLSASNNVDLGIEALSARPLITDIVDDAIFFCSRGRRPEESRCFDT